MTRTVLVTGFEPFGGRSRNASGEAVARLPSVWPGPERLVTAELPVAFDAAPRRLRELVARARPDLVLCVGEAGGRDVVSVERVALNLVDARIPDNDGAAPADRPVVPDGPLAYLSSLPVRACAEAVRSTGMPAEVSYTAGTFVCNTVFYALQHLLAADGDGGADDARARTRGGFVHVPAGGGVAADDDVTRLARSLAAVVRTALDREEDVPTSAGTLD